VASPPNGVPASRNSLRNPLLAPCADASRASAGDAFGRSPYLSTSSAGGPTLTAGCAFNHASTSSQPNATHAPPGGLVAILPVRLVWLPECP
jgi:hypothetical protein